jgi:hypothetical protein
LLAVPSTLRFYVGARGYILANPKELAVTERRELIISRKYQNGGNVVDLFVAQVSGGILAGSVYQCEIWENNVEQTQKRTRSGNHYEVRRAFLNALLDLSESGWEKRGAATFGSPDGKFFDPYEL